MAAWLQGSYLFLLYSIRVSVPLQQISEKSNLRIGKLENIFISQIDEEGVDT